MRQLKRGGLFVLDEPFTWLCGYFINAFMNEVRIKDRTMRLKLLLRLMLPMFLVSYPLALILSLILTSQFNTHLLLATAVGVLSGFLVGTTWDVVMNRPVGMLGGMWLGIWLGMWAAISWSSWIGILLTTIGGIALGCGVVNSINKITTKNLEDNKKYSKNLKKYGFEGIGLLVRYLIGGATPSSEQDKTRRIGIAVVRWFIVSLIGLLVVIIVTFTIYNPWWITLPIYWAVTMGSMAGILAGVTLSSARNRLSDWGVGIGGGIVIGDMLVQTVPTTIVAITPAIVTAIVLGITTITMCRGTSSASITRKTNRLIFSASIALGIIAAYLGGPWVIILFPLCYAISYCQLPLWLPSSISLNTAAWTAYEAPSEVFVQLHASSLDWDEWEVLLNPLEMGMIRPQALGYMMYLAVEQDIEQATEILAFIEAERPLLFAAARSGAHKKFLEFITGGGVGLKIQGDISEVTQQLTRLETLANKLNISSSPSWLALLRDIKQSITESVMKLIMEHDIEQVIEAWLLIKIQDSSLLAAAQIGLRRGFLQLIAHEMEPQKTLQDISTTAQQFAKLQVLSTKLNMSELDELMSDLGEVFALLNNVCQDAVRYLNSLGWPARHDALQNMITNLRNIKKFASGSIPSVIDRWEGTAQHELDKLEQEPRKTDQIKNPYVVGHALQPGTSLFVGRQDFVHQLEQGLGRGSHGPTFFLSGERRMGKSSTLRQLPFLLDARHFLPIFFDLQAPEMTSSIAVFLGTIAEKMSGIIEEKAGIQVEPLVTKDLQEAQRENEAAVYYAFNEWLKQVERVLEQNERIVLLSFDEFENLELAGKAKYLNLHLLLNWFRSVIQNRPQLALLFSGGKSVSEIGQETGLNWSGYFVNVQTFRVSFLHDTEARHLITQPIPDYPIEQIFGMSVVDEIIRVTGCHPFLVQAVCSNLVNNLNVDSRNRAEIQDVTVAVTQVLEDWEDSYFQDLWTRTDAEQRTCLTALNELGKGDIQQVAQHLHRNEEITRGTMQSVRHSLQILLKRDLVLLENETYQIATPIFSQWVERNS